jgi:hypothetical protein
VIRSECVDVGPGAHVPGAFIGFPEGRTTLRLILWCMAQNDPQRRNKATIRLSPENKDPGSPLTSKSGIKGATVSSIQVSSATRVHRSDLT